jgi:hypothetical protein
MKQAIRALGWATTIFWIMLLLFTVTAVYSAFQIRPGFGGTSTSTSDHGLMVSLPFSLYNGGFYDISEINFSTLVRDSYGLPLTNSSTFIQLIPKGTNTTVNHKILVDMRQMSTKSLSRLLFNDTSLSVDAILKLNYASAIPFQISTNFTIPWGAPLASLTMGRMSVSPYNSTYSEVTVPLSFENHSPLGLNGTMRLELVDITNRIVGRGTVPIIDASHSRFETAVEILMSGNPSNVTEARLYFDTSIFHYGPMVIPRV